MNRIQTTTDTFPSGRIERRTVLADVASEFPDRVSIRCPRPFATHVVENVEAIAHPETADGRVFELRTRIAGQRPRPGDTITCGRSWLVTSAAPGGTGDRFIARTVPASRE